jgi:hypothetical protein
VAGDTEWERTGITGATVTATIVRGLIERDAGNRLALTEQERVLLSCVASGTPGRHTGEGDRAHADKANRGDKSCWRLTLPQRRNPPLVPSRTDKPANTERGTVLNRPGLRYIFSLLLFDSRAMSVIGMLHSFLAEPI